MLITPSSAAAANSNRDIAGGIIASPPLRANHIHISIYALLTNTVKYKVISGVENVIQHLMPAAKVPIIQLVPSGCNHFIP